MKKIIFTAALLSITAAGMTSCSGNQSDKNSDDAALDSLVSSFEIRQSVKSAVRSYEVKSPDLSYYLTMSASVQWPEQFGDYDIKVLQDSIVRFMYGDSVKADITRATADFVITPPSDILDGAKATVVDSVPSLSTSSWSFDISAKLVEYTMSTVTYNVINYSYLGGAHPMTTYHPFTYAFKLGKVLTVGNMFKKDSEPQLLKMINQALADEHEVLPSHLESAGFFGAVTIIGDPYVEDNVIKFHYDAYAIAPYAMGPIDVTIYPGQLKELLTPEAAALFEIED